MAIRTGPLGYSFTLARLLQFTALVIICGVTANLGVTVNRLDAPKIPVELLVAIIVSGVGMLYTLTTLILHLFGVFIRYLISSVLDTVLFGALVAVAVLVGKPLTNLSCPAVKRFNNNIISLGDVIENYSAASVSDGSTSGSSTTSNLLNDIELRPEDILRAVPVGEKGLESVGGLPRLGNTISEVESNLGDYDQWVGRVGRWCVLMKVVWGLAIFAAVLMVVGGVVAFLLWRKTKAIPWDEKGEERGVFEPTLQPPVRGAAREEPVLHGVAVRNRYGEVQSYGNADAGRLRV